MGSVFEELEKRGYEKAFKEGFREAFARRVARNLLAAKALPYEGIADVTELSIEEIKALDNEMGGAD